MYLVLYLEKFLITSFSLPFRVLSLWDWSLVLEDYHPSVLLHCWLGHLTYKIVSEMTYNVSSGTLNPTIPCHTVTLTLTDKSKPNTNPAALC